MLPLLFAVACLQEITPPEDWAQVGHARFAPAGTAPGACMLFAHPTRDFKGTAEEWHEVVWKEVTKGLTLSGRVTDKPGSFLSSVADYTDADGKKKLPTLYTAVADGRGYTVVFAAGSEELRLRYRRPADKIMAAARPVPPPVANGLRYIAPSGWMFRDDGAGNVQFVPPDSAPGAPALSISILGAEPFDSPADARLNQLVDVLFRSPEPANQDGLISSMGGFRAVALKGKTQRFAAYAARWENKVQLVFVMARDEEIMEKYTEAVEGMIRRTSVPGSKPDPGLFKPAPIPAADKDVKIVGAYFGSGLDTRHSVDPAAGGVWQRNYREVLVLFENGVAVRADILRSGLKDSTFVAEGFATLDVAGMKEPPNRRFGRWTEEEGTLTVNMFQGPPLALKREGGDLKGAWTWNPMKPVDGLKPDGKFVRKLPESRNQSITLKSDESFACDRLNDTMGGTLINPDFPVRGRGTYEIRKWSLILRFDTGFVQSINLMTDDKPAPEKLFIGGYLFERAP